MRRHRLELPVIAAVGAFLLWRIDAPIGVRADSWSEAQVMISGWGYAQDGFLRHAGLPQYQVGPPVDPYFLYSGYPSLSNILYGALHIAGADVHSAYRLPAILCSLIALWIWFQLIRFVVDRQTAVFATVALATSAGFLAYADNIHAQAYPLPFQFAALLCCARALAIDATGARKWLLAAAACAFVVSLLTVELHLWLPVACTGIGLALRRRLSFRAGAAVGLAIAAGLAVQWSQSRLGSPVPAKERPGLTESLYRRSIGFDEAVDTPHEDSGTRLTIGGYPRFLAQRFAFFYGAPIWMLALVTIVALAAARVRGAPTERPAVALLGVLLAAGLPWLAIMMQQSAVHPSALRQLLPCYALALGILWSETMHAWRERRRPALLPALLALSLLSVGLHARRAWEEAHARSGNVGTRLENLAQLPPDAVILTNDHLVPFVRYSARRPAYFVPNGLPRTGMRTYMDLTLHYLRDLYGGQLPNLVYVYRLAQTSPPAIAAAVERDELLRLLVTGHTRALSEGKLGVALGAVLSGRGSHCPILLRGQSWVAFDMRPVIDPILRLYAGGTVPTLREMPPPT
jgi:4-amino-4-deoxy-L-arabinose transferase-like glycosyltransferase